MKPVISIIFLPLFAIVFIFYIGTGKWLPSPPKKGHRYQYTINYNYYTNVIHESGGCVSFYEEKNYKKHIKICGTYTIFTPYKDE